MDKIILFIQDYANIINFTLLIAIVGWLFVLTQNYKDTINEKFESKIAAKDIEIQALSDRLKIITDQLNFLKESSSLRIEKTQEDLERTEKWYEREIKVLEGRLSTLLSEEGITKEAMVAEIDTSLLRDDIKNTLVDVLKEISTIEDTFTSQIENPGLFLEQAKGYSLSQQWLKAAKSYDKYIVHNPSDWEAQFLRGVAYVNSRQNDETNIAALRSYNEAITFMPRDVDQNIKARLYAYRAAVSKRLSRLEEAESDLLFAQKYATDDYEVHDIIYNLAAVYAMQGKRGKMIDMVCKLVGRPGDIAHIRAHVNTYFKKFANDPEFRELIYRG